MLNLEKWIVIKNIMGIIVMAISITGIFFGYFYALPIETSSKGKSAIAFFIGTMIMMLIFSLLKIGGYFE